jgi:MFS transporter, DHA1 family, multidrug resistance protein
VLQGVGTAATAGIALAIVRDLFEDRAAATMLSRLFLVMGVAPVLAPTIGGEILQFTSWRGVFALLAVYGIVVLALGSFALRETLPPERRHHGGISDSLRTYGGLFRDRRYVGLIVVAGLTMAALFTYVSGSSFVYQQQFGLDEQQFGLLFGMGAVWLISATQLNPVLLRWFSPAQILVTSTVVGTIAGGVLLALSATGTGGLFGVAVPLWAVLFASGFALPKAPALALAEYGESAGSAAALLGAVQFGVGAAVSPLVGLLGNDALAMGAVIVTALALAVAVLLVVVRPWQTTEPQQAQTNSGSACARAARPAISSSDGRAVNRSAASSSRGRISTSPVVSRKASGRPSTQCTAASMSSCSLRGSYHVLAVCSRPSHGASEIALIVCIATPRSEHNEASASNSDA